MSSNPLILNSKIHNNIIVSNPENQKITMSFPSGMIVAWNKPDKIPTGWTKCDGGDHAKFTLKRSDRKLNNGVIIPDFRGRMLRMTSREEMSERKNQLQNPNYNNQKSMKPYSATGKIFVHNNQTTGGSNKQQ